MALRYYDKFTSIDGTISYTFPTNLLSQQTEQTYRTPRSVGVGANYAHDHLGYGPPPKDVKRFSFRCMIVAATPTAAQTILDEAQSECYRIGKGYLYRLDVDGSTYRRCLARMTGAPSITFDSNFQFGATPALFNFDGFGDFYATTATTGSRSISAGQSAVTITNAGNIPVLSGIVLTLTFTSATTYVVIRVNGREFRWDGYASEGDILRIGNPDGHVGLEVPSLLIGGAPIGGAAIGPDYSANVFGQVTGDFLYLEPGANQLIIETDGAFTLGDSHYGGFG